MSDVPPGWQELRRAADVVVELEQEYEGHEDGTTDENPTCVMCERWANAMWALEDALASVKREGAAGA